METYNKFCINFVQVAQTLFQVDVGEHVSVADLSDDPLEHKMDPESFMEETYGMTPLRLLIMVVKEDNSWKEMTLVSKWDKVRSFNYTTVLYESFIPIYGAVSGAVYDLIVSPNRLHNGARAQVQTMTSLKLEKDWYSIVATAILCFIQITLNMAAYFINKADKFS